MAKFIPTITAYLVLYIIEGYGNMLCLLLKVEHISYTMGTRALPDIYTLALRPVALVQVHIYQKKHSCPWYNYYL